jgi:hypothetical protein
VAKRKPEPTQPGNPLELTINQHVHSKAAIARFANDRGLVTALRRPDAKLIDVRADNRLFCAQRVWSQKAEGVIFKSVEDAFQREVERALLLGSVFDHEAVTAYFSIWQVRSKLAMNPPDDWVLNGVDADVFTQEEEERLEKRGFMFMRPTGIPSRICAESDAMAQHHANMNGLRRTRWGFMHSPRDGLLCPDCPRTLWMPINRHVLLVAGYSNQPLPEQTVKALNRSAFDEANSWVFGHPEDVGAFLQENPSPWGQPSKTRAEPS